MRAERVEGPAPSEAEETPTRQLVCTEMGKYILHTFGLLARGSEFPVLPSLLANRLLGNFKQCYHAAFEVL